MLDIALAFACLTPVVLAALFAVMLAIVASDSDDQAERDAAEWERDELEEACRLPSCEGRTHAGGVR